MDPNSNGEGGSLGDIPTRPMRVKILYTFDSDAKTTCLARFPDTLNIPVVPIDEQSQVGVIDLHQCIQAIVSASPEIMSKLESGDFTVYNFDYTEHDTPIVGQGRLSSLLSLPPATQEKTMITGRVCKNIQALFSNGVKEILEVKFKLTPLSKVAHSKHAKNTGVPRSMSPATSSGFDPNAWNASLQQNHTQPSNDYFNVDAFSQGGDDDTAVLDRMFGSGSGSHGDTGGLQQAAGVGVPETPTDPPFAYNPAFAAQSHSAPGSRAGSPIMRPVSNLQNEQLRHQSFSGQPSNFTDQSRPGSRASVRSEVNSRQHQRQPSTSSLQQQYLPQSNDAHYNKDGQSRKRAKVTQADWRGKSSFGTKPVDLRVTAATASSMHMYRPIAKRPTAPGADLEPPPRMPTPVPQRKLPQAGRQQASLPTSTLRRASTLEKEFKWDNDMMSDAMTSPDGSSPGNSIAGERTPMDIPSSPPLVSSFNHAAPSSPELLALPGSRVADSGYMSERAFTSGAVIESLEEDESRILDIDWQGDFSKTVGHDGREFSLDPTQSSFNVQLEKPGDMDLLPRKQMQGGPVPDTREGSQGLPPQVLGSRQGSLALPPRAVSRAASQDQVSKPPAKRRRQALQRSRTTSNDSDVGSPAPSETEGRSRGARESGASRRKTVIEQRLSEAIARGEMPVYCAHCGAIETPTWRKIYVKTVQGKPGPLDSVEGDGETIGIQALETNEESGEIMKFLIRKTVKRTRDYQPDMNGFVEMNVCNPCGLWFNKFRAMRPEERWHKKTTSRRKRNRTDDGLPTDGIEPQSEAFFTDQVGPEDAMDDGVSPDDGQSDARRDTEPVPAPSGRPRSNSLQGAPFRRGSQEADSGPHIAADAMKREVQSSPVRSQGSEGSPIELDLTPKPTRRLLFPSPRQAGEVKSLDDTENRKAPVDGAELGSASRKAVSVAEFVNVRVYKTMTPDKENMAPLVEEDDDPAVAYLFGGSPMATFKTPIRKTPPKSQDAAQLHDNDLLKTPTLSSRKRKPLTPNQNATNNADARVNDFMTSPSSTRYFLRSTPSRLERTPGGGSQNSGGCGPSPFSRQLAQMLNEATGDNGATFTSPSGQEFDFSDLPTFITPGRQVDWKSLDEMLSSEFANYEDHQDMGLEDEQAGGER